MKLYVLSFALSMTAVAAPAQSELPTPPAPSALSGAIHSSTPSADPAHSQSHTGEPKPSAAGTPVSLPPAVSLAPIIPATAPARQQLQAGAPPLSADARIESRPVDSSVVGEVHCKPLYISTIHLPEAVTSIAVGAPTLFTAEHVENEPKLVYVSPLTHDAAESNLLVALASGQTISLKLISSGNSAAQYDVDFVLDYRPDKALLAFAAPPETGIAQPSLAATAPLTPFVTSYPVRSSARTVQPVSVIDAALATQAGIATPHWITADDLVNLDKANATATKAIAASLGSTVQVGNTMMVSYSVLNVSREWVQVLTPQIQLGNPVQKKPGRKGSLAETVSIQDFRQNVVKLALGERLDGVVQFSRPGFPKSFSASVDTLQGGTIARMRKLIRFMLGWTFGVEALIFLLVIVDYVSRGFHGDSAAVRSGSMLVFLAFVLVDGAASLGILRKTTSAKGWGIAASLGNLLFAISPILRGLSFFWNSFKSFTWLAALIGAVGLLVCSRIETREGDPINPAGPF